MKGKIFNAQEVQSLISGNKTQFREVIKVQPNNDKQQFGTIACSSDSRDKGKHQFINPDDTKDRTELFKRPYQVGQKIFVKESFLYGAKGRIGFADFKLIGYYSSDWQKKPAQQMKQEHSRLTLQIKEIRVERLQSISCADYFAETGRRPSITHADLDCGTPDPRSDFKDYWNATHKKPEEKFEANPWVWVIDFEVVK